jgi:hypothetical protein
VRRRRLNIAPAGFLAAKEGGVAPPLSRGSITPRWRASREGLASVIAQIDPDRIVPIANEAREWFAESFEDVVLRGGGGDRFLNGVGGRCSDWGRRA